MKKRSKKDNDWPKYIKWTDGSHDKLCDCLYRLSEDFGNKSMTEMHNDEGGDIKLVIKLLKQFQRSTDWDGS